MATIPLERLSAKQGPAFIARVHAMRQERLVREREQAEKAAKEKSEARRKENEERAKRIRAEVEARRCADLERQEIEEDIAFELESAAIAKEDGKFLIKCAIGFVIVLVTLIAVV